MAFIALFIISSGSSVSDRTPSAAPLQTKRFSFLSIITVVFLPLSFITGLLGINVGGIPGEGYKWAFLIVTCILVAISVVVLAIFRRIKWL